MTTINWNTGASGVWNDPTKWAGGAVPGPTDDAVIDAAPVSGAYTVSIAQGETETVNSLTMNGTTNLSGANSTPYDAASLELDGTLIFNPGAPGGSGNPPTPPPVPPSTGLLGGSLQTIIHTTAGSTAVIENAGTVNAFIQAEGNLTFSGTNGLYINNWLQALGSTVTVDTPIAELSGTTLFDGIFEAQSAGATVDLGGAAGGVVDIATLEGPPLNAGGWAELIFNGPDATTDIKEWNGSAYVPVETTLTTIANRGTVDVLAGRDYMTSNALAVQAGGLLNLHVGTFNAAGGLNNGGIVQGYGTIASDVTNTGTLMAEGGPLDVTGSLTGSGTIKFDYDQRLGQTVSGGATAELNSVAAGQTVMMMGDDTLQLDAPTAFAGTISAEVGDKIVLKGDIVTSATINNDTLVLNNGSLALTGDYTGEHFALTTSGNDTTLTLASGSETPTGGPGPGQPTSTGPGPGQPTSPGGGTQPTTTPGAPPAASSEFDPAYYLAQNPDVAASGLDPFTHYEEYGWKEGRNPDAVFNVKYYLNQNPDVAAAGVDPLTQYEQFGWKEGRDPSSTFSTKSYLQANPDVAAAHVDPLQHYLAHGMTEGRMAFLATPNAVGPQNPLVDNNYYFSQYADIKAAGVDPFAHYAATGWKEGRNPDALFNTQYYLQQNPDVKAAGIDPLLHYEQTGWKEGRNPSADFSTNQYLAANPDVKAAGLDPLVHYEQYGMHEGRAIYHT